MNLDTRKQTTAQEVSSKVQTGETFGRQQPRQRGRVNFFARFLIWSAVNLVLWPVIRPLVKRLNLFDFIFVLYPGTQADITSYIPLWFHWKIRKILPLSILGISTRGKTGRRGLTTTLMYEPEELTKEELALILEKVRRCANSVGAHSIALAGRLPGVVLGHGLPLNPPFLKGDRGGVFTVVETLLRVLEIEGLTQNSTVGILGVGYLGGKVLRHLQGLGFTSIVGIDPRAKGYKNARVILTNDVTRVSLCRVVIVLTGRGADIVDTISHFQEGVVILDDTHPQLPAELVQRILQKGGKVYKTALGLSGIRFVPEIPGYGAEWLPGCVIEALVSAHGHHIGAQQEFDQKGRELGLRPFLIHSKGGS